MKYLLSLVLILLVACAPQSSKQGASLSESERLNAWFEERYEEELQFSPITLTYLGRKELYDQFDDFSAEAEAKKLAWRAATVEEMESEFDYDALGSEAKMSYDIWKYLYTQAKAGEAFSDHSYIFEQMGGAQSELATFLLNFHRVDDVSDLEAYISRIGGLATGIDQLLVRAKVSSAKGIRPPRFAYEGAIDQAEKLLIGKPFDPAAKTEAPLWEGVRAKISELQEAKTISETQASDYRRKANKALRNQFQPSYKNLISWLKEDMANTSEIGLGASALPDGMNYYDYQLSEHTTTSMTANEVHEVGLKEVARLRAAIEAIKDELNFKGDLKEFFAFIREDPQFFFPDTDDGRQGYIDGAKHFLGLVEKRLPEYFGLLPKADLVVKRVEAFREQDGAAQHYYSGTPDGSRPGVYYAHLSDMTAMPKNQMEVIAYHEGLPGHHMQISIAQEVEGIPTFRSQVNFNAYTEGWALYSEILAGEMGAYEDPYSKIGQLSSEIWRGIRLVVDTGLHSKGWTEEQAVEYFLANSPEPEESIRSEVRRYMVWPGQATSYKIGMLKIMQLRDEAQNQLGDDFDIRGFHDMVLGGGALPLSILEKRTNNWIAEQRQ